MPVGGRKAGVWVGSNPATHPRCPPSCSLTCASVYRARSVVFAVQWAAFLRVPPPLLAPHSHAPRPGVLGLPDAGVQAVGPGRVRARLAGRHHRLDQLPDPERHHGSSVADADGQRRGQERHRGAVLHEPASAHHAVGGDPGGGTRPPARSAAFPRPVSPSLLCPLGFAAP